MNWFTGKAGSLIHPLAMAALTCLWGRTALLGLQARNARLEGSSEHTSLLQPPQSVRNRYHHKLSASLLFLTAFFMFLGMLNTFQRANRLFPGPHLYGGFLFLLAVTLNVAMVPWFKDMKVIRNFHAAVGFLVFLLLLNQIWSGWPILKAVLKTVPW